MSDIVQLSYQDVTDAVEKIAAMVPGPGLRRIIAVARGGLVPATMLAHRLNIRRVDVLSIISRNRDGSPLETPVVQGFPPPDNEPRTVIVEDIIDTGRTYEAIRRIYPTLPVLAIVSRSKQVRGAIEVDPKAWIVFPWAPNE